MDLHTQTEKKHVKSIELDGVYKHLKKFTLHVLLKQETRESET